MTDAARFELALTTEKSPVVHAADRIIASFGEDASLTNERMYKGEFIRTILTEQERVQQIGESGRVDEELVETVPRLVMVRYVGNEAVAATLIVKAQEPNHETMPGPDVPIFPGEPFLGIRSIATIASRRRKDHGKQVIRAVQQLAAENNFSGVRAYHPMTLDAEAAGKLWGANGFVRTTMLNGGDLAWDARGERLPVDASLPTNQAIDQWLKSY